MTIFLAAIAARSSTLPGGIEERIAEAIAPAGSTSAWRHGGFAISWVDLGLWPGASVVMRDERMALVAGDPVLSAADSLSLQRQLAIERLADELAGEDPVLLRQAEGSFCGLVFDARSQRLTAFTDKLGVRPLYWAHIGDVTYLASAQWLLERLSDVPLEPDWLAAAEIACFGFPLTDRTLFSDIRSLTPGSTLVVAADSVALRRYWSWESLPESPHAGDALVRHVGETFDAAVADRLQGQHHVMAYLSGGLDSRLIVARLRNKGARVSTVNFAPPGSQDMVLGRQAADALGADHSEYALNATTFLDRQKEVIDQWRARHLEHSEWPDVPTLVWSGDGGSVTLGHVYMTETIVETARTGSIEATARAISVHNRYGLTPHLFAKKWKHLAQAHLRGIVADIASRPSVEPGRNAHLFFMLNDQRRHLTSHFERVHLTGFDLVLPFFDGRFVASVLSSRVDPYLRHALYNQFMKTLTGTIAHIPWQSYPGHHPSPVPVDDGLRKQWDEGWHDVATQRRIRRAFMLDSLAGLTSARFPAEVLNRPKLIASLASGLLGVAGKSYLVDNAVPFLRASSSRRPARS